LSTLYLHDPLPISLRLTKLAKGLDNGTYAMSWYEPADGEITEAGLTSHL
jgi:hypothetical protein